MGAHVQGAGSFMGAHVQGAGSFMGAHGRGAGKGLGAHVGGKNRKERRSLKRSARPTLGSAASLGAQSEGGLKLFIKNSCCSTCIIY